MHTSTVHAITTPLESATARLLRAGDVVRITGHILAARDAAHKRLVACLHAKEPLPVDLHGQVIYYVGPSPARPGRVIGAAGPTTAGRMDPYTPQLLAEGLSGMIGKGMRSAAVVEAIKQYGVPYFAAVGGAGALLGEAITSYTVLAWPELGTEALADMTVVDFPAIVAIDVLGNDIYTMGRKAYQGVKS
ncbi:MAG: Fe-S-containing hydro-lyase [Desulfovibrio sp.]|nr:Fe-S-containing hydro-lyase [Desulfovibrio sp.]